MTANTLSRLASYKNPKKDDPEPRERRMICRIDNPGYVAPENDAWRLENSNSENEDDKLREMHEKKLRHWFVKDGKRKRTPKTSPAPKVSTPKIVVKGPSRESQPRLIDEPVVNPADISQEGIDLTNVTFEQYLKHTEATIAKDQSTSVPAEGVKETEPEGVARTDSSDAGDNLTETESEIERIGVGKVTLKKKPQKKKKKGSDEEDSTYMPTAVEKKKLRIKRKAVQTGVIPRNVRARKGGAFMPKSQSGKSEKHIETSKGPETVKVPEVPQTQSIPEVEV
ncbi:hypothetical protein HanLR1_Chr02g0050661 [Helianthus annuus]|nr:hypothetical protein HanLR1_Chr02g0050661 [Helianthus annuus]